MTRAGRPKKMVERQPDGRPKPDKVEPTKELLNQRAGHLARVISLYPMPIAQTLADHQDAGWYIGRLYLAKVITTAERDAAEGWKRVAEDYGRLLMIPKPPVALDMNRREPAAPVLIEDKETINRFKRVKHKYERYWDAVAARGMPVLRATKAALRDEETAIHLLRQGLRALVSA